MSRKVGLSHLEVFGYEGHVFWKKIVLSYSSAVSPNSGEIHHDTRLIIFKFISYYVLIRMHTRARGGLYIYLHKMPGKHPGYGQMLGGEGFR